MHPDFDQLYHELHALKVDNAQIRAEFVQERRRNSGERRRLRLQTALALGAFVGAVFLMPANRAALAQGYGVTLATLNTRLMAVEAKTQFQTADPVARSTTFSGCNVNINDGGGTTDSIVTNAAGDGLGNLTIGYNALQGSGLDTRTGSHNLVLGDRNNYLSYGGLVAGSNNTISGNYASISGGISNVASGYGASVIGGYTNTVSGPYASISGGANGIVSGKYGSISGGSSNTVDGYATSITGGLLNIAHGDYATVTGGAYNTSAGPGAAISGGENNTSGGTLSTVGGGNSVIENTDDGWAAGGTGAGDFHSP